MTSRVLRGDARALPFPDDCIDLIVTSPPYFGLRSYTDGGEHYEAQIGSEATPQEFIAALMECTREMVRVLKPSGSIFLNLGDKYSGASGPKTGERTFTDGHELGGRWPTTPRGRAAQAPPKSLLLLPERYRIACTDELGLIARAVIVWDKPNGLPESVRDRVRRSHEDWVHLTKSPRYFEAVDEIREPHTSAATTTAGRRHGGAAFGAIKNGGGDGTRHTDGHPLGKLPGSVWTIPTQPLRVPSELDVDHFAAFPMEWPRRLITGWCPPDGIVLDPFGGTGTTALVADVLGRIGISLDASADYCRLARWRTTDERERATAAGHDRSRVVQPTVDAPSLFAMIEETA